MMLLTFVIQVVDFHELCPRQSLQLLLPTFPVLCHRPNSITTTQTSLSQTLLLVCDHDFPCQEALVQVSVMEFGLYHTRY